MTETLSSLINQLRQKTKELEEIAYQYEGRNQVMIDNLSKIRETLDDKNNNLKVERQLKNQILESLDQNINQELVSPLPNQLMTVCEDVELIDLECAEVLGEEIKPGKYKEKEYILNERALQKESEYSQSPNFSTNNYSNNYSNNPNTTTTTTTYTSTNTSTNTDSSELPGFFTNSDPSQFFNSDFFKNSSSQVSSIQIDEDNYPNLSKMGQASQEDLIEFGQNLGKRINDAFNDPDQSGSMSAEEIVQKVLSAVNQESFSNPDNDFDEINQEDVFINGQEPNKFFDKVKYSKVEALKKILLVDQNPLYQKELSKFTLDQQLEQLNHLHQKLRLKHFMYLQHLPLGQRLGKETHYLKERSISKGFPEINNGGHLPTFEEYLRNFQKDPTELETSEESNQEMLDRLFGDLDDLQTDLYVQIIRSMLLSSMLRSPEMEENFYKKRIHDLESLVKYIQKYEKPVPNDRIHLDPAIICPEISMSKVLEADIPDFILFKDLQEDNILQEMIKYYFHSEHKERINFFLAEMQEIERATNIEPDVDHQFKILDDSFFEPRTNNYNQR